MKRQKLFGNKKNSKKMDPKVRAMELREEMEKLTGNGTVFCGLPGSPEKSWNPLFEYEKAAETTYFKKLLQAGFRFADSAQMNDREVSEKLWELVRKLAEMRVFFNSTDHLSDRQMYDELCNKVLHEETKDVPISPQSAFHIDLTNSGESEDGQNYLKYYADEDIREMWRRDFPECTVPAHESLPYDRDRFLPKPY